MTDPIVEAFRRFSATVEGHLPSCSFESTHLPYGDYCDCGRAARIAAWRDALAELERLVDLIDGIADSLRRDKK